MRHTKLAAMAARILAFDSSTERLHLAVGDGTRELTRCLDGGAQASALLIPAALALLAQAGLAPHQLDAVAFGRGPGAFTGLRSACAVAQGLALGLGLPVLPIDSLLIVAEDSAEPGAGQEIAVAMDARMQQAYWARYRREDGARWRTLGPPALIDIAALAAQWRAQPPEHAAGSALPLLAQAEDLHGLRPAAERDRAAALLRLAQQAHADGGAVDAALALPHYVRDKVALTSAERLALRASA